MKKLAQLVLATGLLYPGGGAIRRPVPVRLGGAGTSEKGPLCLLRSAGRNIWRLCKTYGRLIGQPRLKPHDLRHGVAMEILENSHDLEAVRAMLGHVRLETTQLYAQIRPAQLKQAVGFYEDRARVVVKERLEEKSDSVFESASALSSNTES